MEQSTYVQNNLQWYEEQSKINVNFSPHQRIKTRQFLGTKDTCLKLETSSLRLLLNNQDMQWNLMLLKEVLIDTHQLGKLILQ